MAQKPKDFKLLVGKQAWLSSGQAPTGGSSAPPLRFLRHIIDKSVESAVVQGSIAIFASVFIAIALSRLHFNLAAFGFLSLVIVALLARLGDFLLSVVVSAVASLCLAYIAAPQYSFRTDIPLDILAGGSFLVVSLMITWLVSRLREISEKAHGSVNRKLVEAEERVRARIAKELHDDIEQRLALLAVQATQLGRGPSTPAHEVSLTQRMQEQASRIAADVQVLAYELRPYKLEYLGIARVMKSFCERFGVQHDLEIDFKCHNVPNDVPLDASASLVRVLQEALLNSAQHSRAYRVRVELSGMSEAIHLTIHDSGVGFNPQMALKGSGLGLVSMQERLKLVNGELSIRSQPGRGSMVHACVPLLMRPSDKHRVRSRAWLRIAVAASAGILLAAAIQIAQVRYPPSSRVNGTSSMPKETNHYLTSNHVSVKVFRKRAHSESTNPIAPSPAFRRVRVEPNEVDYIAEDVTIRHFITRSRGTRNGGNRFPQFSKAR